MSNVTHQNPNFHLNKLPHKLSTKHVLVKTKPTKRSPRANNKNKTNNIINNNNDNNNAFTNSKPLKVVHISNPMKFVATPTEFRALVQGLTGRDAALDWLDDDHHCVNYQATVAVGGASDGDGSSDGGVTDDQLVQVHQDNINNYEYSPDVTSFSAYFGPSDHLNYDCFEPFHNGDIDEDFRSIMEDH